MQNLNLKSFVQRILYENRFWRGVGSLALACAVYWLLPTDLSDAGRRVAAIFVLAAFFWALEIIPLYATSLMVILLEIFLLCRPDGVLNMDATGYKVFLMPFGSPIIILFFGGFVLGRAMHLYHLDRRIATGLLRLFGSRPYFVMTGFMAATAFLSMWMSNTATTAMMMAMILPLLDQLERSDPFRKALVLAVAFAANIGGAGTPVGSPPNAIAIGMLADAGIRIDFFSWMKLTIPLVAFLLLVVSGLLYFMYPPRQRTIVLNVARANPFDEKTLLTVLITVLTIGLWLTSGLHQIPAAVIALLAAGLFAVTGLLSRDDFKMIDWDVLVLMWGGLALGEGMELSGLAAWIVGQPFFDQQGLVLIALFSAAAAAMSTFISNTATANLLVPIALSLPGENYLFLGITIALCCSLAMALPISTPPNAIAFSTNMIQAKDMFKAGISVSVIGVILVLLGYQLIIPMVVGGSS